MPTPNLDWKPDQVQNGAGAMKKKNKKAQR